MGAQLSSIPFCSRTRDDNNNLPERPDLNLSEEVIQSQPEATSTPKAVRIEEEREELRVNSLQNFNSLDGGDSGVEHSSDEVEDPPSLNEQNILETRLEEDYEEEEDSKDEDASEDGEEVDLGDRTLSVFEQPAAKDASRPSERDIDLKDLEEEILGDVEPVTEDKDQDKVEDQDITDKVLEKRGTADLITDMLNQLVVDGGTNDHSQVAMR